MKQEWRHFTMQNKLLNFASNVKKENLEKKSILAKSKKSPIAADAEHPNLLPRRPLAVVPPHEEHVVAGGPKSPDEVHEKPQPNPIQNKDKEAGLAARPSDKDPFTYRSAASGTSGGLSEDRSLADVLDALDGLLLAGLVDEALEARQLIERQLLATRV